MPTMLSPLKPLPAGARRAGMFTATALLAGLAVGCQVGPLDGGDWHEWKETVTDYHRAQLERTRPARLLEEDPNDDVARFLAGRGRLEAVDKTSGPAAYAEQDPKLGNDLLGNPDSPRQEISLRQAVVAAMVTGLDARVARIDPVIADAKVEQARAAFDPLAYMETGVGRTNSVLPPGVSPGVSGVTRTDSATGKAGVKQKFAYGTLVDVSGELTSSHQKPSQYKIDSWYQSNLALQVTQPLLKGGGRDVNEAEINRAKVAAEIERARLRKTLIQTAADTAEAYWQLAYRRDEAAIREQLVARTRAMVKRLEPRLAHDVLGADISQVVARLSAREGDLAQSRAGLRENSDRLKRLLDDDRVSLASETVLYPSEQPQVGSLTLDVVQAVALALDNRPDLAESLLGIEDAGIRLKVARNAKLPLLDLKAGVALHGLDQDAGRAISKAAESKVNDETLSLRFEQALGNRDGEAQELAERQGKVKATLTYKKAARDAVLDVKIALRKVIVGYELIARAKATRRSAAEALRVAERQLDEGANRSEGFTTLIDRVLSRQDELSRAEVEEARNRYDFMIALARLDQAMGVSLDRFGVQDVEMDEEKKVREEEEKKLVGELEKQRAKNQPLGTQKAGLSEPDSAHGAAP